MTGVRSVNEKINKFRKSGEVMGTSLATDGSDKKKVMLTSILFMGLGHIVHLKQWVKGIFFAIIEVIFLCFIPFFITKLDDLVHIGKDQSMIPVAERQMSTFMLIDGIIALAFIAIFIVIYVLSVKSALADYREYCISGKFADNRDATKGILGKAFPIVGLAPALILIVFFVIVPLIFSITAGFTNWSNPDHIPPGGSVNWVGLENYIGMFGGEAEWSSAFLRVAGWTLIWGFCATFTNYFGGMIMAVIFNQTKLKIAPVFRAIFILPYAIPNILSMMVWKNLLNGSSGTVNRTLEAMGLINDAIPWLSDVNYARMTCVLVNLWAGFPYFMMLIAGQMTAISTDIFEAAAIDGANKFQIFKSITLPMVLYQTVPLIIMSFTHNVNNFGVIYFLTGGAPNVASSTTTKAGGTDIVVTWIYKLTMDDMNYKNASVLAMFVFIVLAPFAIFNFMNTKSFKEGEL